MAKSAKNWNELQDEGPLEGRVERKEPFVLRSDFDKLAALLALLEDTVDRERKIALRVRIVVLILAVPLAVAVFAWLLNALADLRA